MGEVVSSRTRNYEAGRLAYRHDRVRSKGVPVSPPAPPEEPVDVLPTDKMCWYIGYMVERCMDIMKREKLKREYEG